MRCCASCAYWDRASRKVPLNAVKVFDDVEHSIKISFGKKEVEIKAWRWELKDKDKERLIGYLRFCFYGKGLITPWDDCEYYEPRRRGGAECEVGLCPYSYVCPKIKFERTSYIG